MACELALTPPATTKQNKTERKKGKSYQGNNERAGRFEERARSAPREEGAEVTPGDAYEECKTGRQLSVHWSLQNGAASDQLREFGWSGGYALKKEWEARKCRGFPDKGLFHVGYEDRSEPGLQV